MLLCPLENIEMYEEECDKAWRQHVAPCRMESMCGMTTVVTLGGLVSQQQSERHHRNSMLGDVCQAEMLLMMTISLLVSILR